MKKSGRIVVAGGSGFVGGYLVPDLLENGYEVVILTRNPSPRGDSAKEIAWDGRSEGAWFQAIDGAVAVINLAGRSINTRHTPQHKKEILESRVDSTRILGQAIERAVQKPTVWIQAGALAIYGDPGDAICDEHHPQADDFLAQVAKDWEHELFNSPTPATRKAVLRIGLVLARGGGALDTLVALTKGFLGGQVGSGKQYVSWIHIADFNEIILRVIEDPALGGPLNACTSTPVTNAEFMRELRRSLHRPWSPPAPAFAVRLGALLMGTEPDLALGGRRCIPRKLTEHGFRFGYTDLYTAFTNLLR